MKKVIEALLVFLASSAFKGGIRANSAGQMELAKLKMALMYVKSVKTFRLLFMSVLGMGVCMVLFLAGLVLLHVSLFVYSPWSSETKFWLGLSFSAVYLIVTVVIFSQIFASDKWLRIFQAEAITEHLNKEAGEERAQSFGTRG